MLVWPPWRSPLLPSRLAPERTDGRVAVCVDGLDQLLDLRRAGRVPQMPEQRCQFLGDDESGLRLAKGDERVLELRELLVRERVEELFLRLQQSGCIQAALTCTINSTEGIVGDRWA